MQNIASTPSLSALEQRRKLGRFDTPRPLSQSVTTWAVRSSQDLILEPSSGAGVFIRSAVSRLAELGRSSPLPNIWACDIDSTATAELAESENILRSQILTKDFLQTQKEDYNSCRFDAIIGNPPYVSLHRMSKDQRKSGTESARRCGMAVDRKASLWAYFLVHSCSLLAQGGRLAFVLPEALIHVDYARQLLRSLATSFGRLEWISIRERCFLGEGADERVGVLLADGWGAKGSAHVYLSECPTVAALEQRLKSNSLSEHKSKIGQLNGHAVPYLLGGKAPVIAKKIERGTSALGEFLDVKIGVVTGANKFFVLSQELVDLHGLPQNCLLPIISRFPVSSGLRHVRRDWEKQRKLGCPVWLFFPTKDDRRKRVLDYLALFPEEARKLNRTFAKRQHWSIPLIGPIPDAFLRYMGDVAPILTLNPSAITCTNTIHRVYFKSGVSTTQRRLIALSLHSSISKLSAEFEGRSYGSGVLKLEPSECKRVRLVIPAEVSAQEVDRIYKETDSLLRASRKQEATALVDDWLKTTGSPFPRVSWAEIADCLSLTWQRRNARI